MKTESGARGPGRGRRPKQRKSARWGGGHVARGAAQHTAHASGRCSQVVGAGTSSQVRQCCCLVLTDASDANLGKGPWDVACMQPDHTGRERNVTVSVRLL
jgi:hypothetical protein